MRQWGRHVSAFTTANPSLAARYLELVAASHQARQPLAGLHLVVDAANGAASALARPLLEGLGARLTMIFDHPDGLNINAGCGATAPDCQFPLSKATSSVEFSRSMSCLRSAPSSSPGRRSA